MLKSIFIVLYIDLFCIFEPSNKNNMKTIIERNLDLKETYTLIDKKYIPILDGGGSICQDCGRLIANIAIVSNSKGKHFNVGFDCLEKLLLNNALLCNFNIEQLKEYKKQINKVIRFSKQLKEMLKENPSIITIYFEPQSYKSDWYTFYYMQKGDKIGYNDNVKIKGISYKFLHTTISSIFSNKIEVYYGDRS